MSRLSCSFYPPMDKNRPSTGAEKPLHLFIEAKDQQALTRAKDAVNAILAAAPAKPAYERRNISAKVRSRPKSPVAAESQLPLSNVQCFVVVLISPD